MTHPATAPGERILAWLNRAVSEREALAHAALNHGRGSAWRANGATVEVVTDQPVYADVFEETVVFNEGSPTEEQAVHIAANDPESVLRRCAADRKLIELHRPQQTGAGFPDLQECRTCSADSLGDGYQYLVPAPCPSLLALAEGYGWTEDAR